MIIEIESDWRETGIPCPACGEMTYTDGQARPQCAACLAPVPDIAIWTWLITCGVLNTMTLSQR